MIDAPTLGLLITAAAIDAINPYAIEVLLYVIAKMLGHRTPLARVFWLVLTFVLAFFATYLIAGLGLSRLILAMPIMIKQIVLVGIGLAAVIAGVILIKDFFWRHKEPTAQFPLQFAKTIEKLSSHSNNFFGIALLGLYLALVELICTGMPYFAVLGALSSDYSNTTLWLLLLYNLIVILPLLFIAFLVAFGTKISIVQKWTDESKNILRIISGLLIVVVGWILILIANGVINLG